MQALQLFLSQLGFGGGLLFGVPLVVIGLALRGLSRRHLGRLVEARRHRRKIADVTDGPVAIFGTARRGKDGRLAVEEAAGGQRVFVEAAEEVTVVDGDQVVVFGSAAAEAGGPSGYRQDARSWSIDARDDDAVVVVGTPSLAVRIVRLRLQTLAGALVFSTGILIIGACWVVSARL